MATQIEHRYESLWRALFPTKPKDEVISEAVEDTLSEREAEQLRMRFGLTGQSPTSLVETAGRLQTDQDGVRETEAIALRKLRQALGYSKKAR